MNPPDRYNECATGLVNRMEGQRLRKLSEADAELLKSSTEVVTPTAIVVACQVGGCAMQWVISKHSDGTYGKEISVGLPSCQ